MLNDPVLDKAGNMIFCGMYSTRGYRRKSWFGVCGRTATPRSVRVEEVVSWTRRKQVSDDNEEKLGGGLEMVIVFFEVVARFQDESPGWKKLSENLPGEIRKRLNLEEPSVEVRNAMATPHYRNPYMQDKKGRRADQRRHGRGQDGNEPLWQVTICSRRRNGMLRVVGVRRLTSAHMLAEY